MNGGRVYPSQLRADAKGRTVLEHLTSTYKHSSVEEWKCHCDAGRVFIDGHCAQFEQMLQGSELLEYHRPPWQEPEAPLTLWILYEDAEMLALYKPSGLPCLPSELYYEHTVLMLLRRHYDDSRNDQPERRVTSTHSTSAETCDPTSASPPAPTSTTAASILAASDTHAPPTTQVPRAPPSLSGSRTPDAPAALPPAAAIAEHTAAQLTNLPASLPAVPAATAATVAATVPVAVPSPSHRLGVGTSGVLLCAVSAAARTGLGVSLEQRLVKKTYRALLSGVVDTDAFDVDVPIGAVPHTSFGGSVAGAVPGGGRGSKSAISHFTVLRRDAEKQQTLVNVVIPTGRAHQIRIHSAYAGHPLVGDPLYAVGGLPYAVWQGSGGAGAGPEAGAGTTADVDAEREVKVGGRSAGNGSGDYCGAGANVAASGCGGNGGGGGDDDAAGSGACGGGDGGDHAGGSGVSRGSGGAAPSPHWDGYGEGNVRSVAAPAPSAAKTTSRPPLPRDGGYLLHALCTEFAHPVTGEAMRVWAPPPRLLCLPGEEPLEEWCLSAKSTTDACNRGAHLPINAPNLTGNGRG